MKSHNAVFYRTTLAAAALVAGCALSWRQAVAETASGAKGSAHSECSTGKWLSALLFRGEERVRHCCRPPTTYEDWLGDWSENVRTNAAIETCASFREARLRPFLLSEMDPGRNATEEELRILNASIDYIWGDGGFRSFKDRKKLVKILGRTAKKPFAAMVSALVNKKDATAPKIAWITSGDFSGEDMRSVFWTLRNNGAFGSTNVLAALEKSGADEWLTQLWRITTERNAAWEARGGGFANTVTDEGWDGYSSHGTLCRQAFDRAMSLHDYPEPAYLLAALGPFDDELFAKATSLQLDFPVFFDKHLWYNCFPRWCGSHRKMKAFAERCYATGRHDTMVPSYYATAIYKMAKDMAVKPGDYFRDHADELDRIIDVSLPQIANTNAFGMVRQLCGAYATFAYYLKGDYKNAADTWRSFCHEKMPAEVYDAIEGFSDLWFIFDGISGKNRKEFQKLHTLYLAGDYAGFVQSLDKLRKRKAKFDKGEKTYAEEFGLYCRMKTDFPSGKPIVATFPKDKTNWLTYGGAWRMNGKYAYYDGKFNYGTPLQWTAAIPGEFRMELEIAPNGEKKEWQFDFLFKPADLVLAQQSGWPHLSLKFADGKCNLAYGDWDGVYENGSAEKASVDYAGGSVKLAIVYKAGVASFFIGDSDTAVLETKEQAKRLRIVSEGRAKFNGAGVRILSMRVMRP